MKSVVIVCVFILLFVFIFYQSQELRRTYKQEAVKDLYRTEAIQIQRISEKDLQRLPVPIQNYLRYSGVIGKERVLNTAFLLEGQVQIGKDWSKMKVEQYNFFDKQPARISFMSMKVSGLPVFGLDSYMNGKGKMSGKIFGLFPIISGAGPEMDQSEQAVLLSEMCTTPATLIDNRITWETIDAASVRATFNDQGRKVSGVLFFNDKGQLIKFTTEDKLYQEKDKSYRRVPWSVLIKDYKEISGFKIGTYTEAVWHFSKGDFTYGKLHLKELQVNRTGFH